MQPKTAEEFKIDAIKKFDEIQAALNLFHEKEKSRKAEILQTNKKAIQRITKKLEIVKYTAAEWPPMTVVTRAALTMYAEGSKELEALKAEMKADKIADREIQKEWTQVAAALDKAFIVAKRESGILKEQKDNIFSYDRLNEHFNAGKARRLSDKNSKYTAMILPLNPAFIALSSAALLEEYPESRGEGAIFKKYQLKFHVSLPDWNKDMFAEGWGIIRDILMQHRVTLFKVIRAGKSMSNTAGQAGKDVTIYASDNPEKTLIEWGQICQELTEALVRANIPPGFRPHGTAGKREQSVAGSSYICYRYCDEAEENAKRASPWPAPDPCANLRVNVSGQRAIPEWSSRDSLLAISASTSVSQTPKMGT